MGKNWNEAIQDLFSVGEEPDVGEVVALLSEVPPQLAGFKPLLAAKMEADRLVLPAYGSRKVDGIRCLLHPTLGPLSRKLKKIPNHYVRRRLSTLPHYLDGELVTYDENGEMDDFNTIQSKVMSHEGEPDFKLIAFDHFGTPSAPYTARRATLVETLRLNDGRGWVVLHDEVYIEDLDHLYAYEEECVRDGWEGAMLRSPTGRYKFGRSTAIEGILLKVKRFDDSEAVIVEAIELERNKNEPVMDALGHMKRSSHKANKVKADTLGALSVEWRGVRFEIGTGYDAATRDDLWARRDSLPGLTVNFKYQGVEREAPRFPVFRGIRYDVEAQPIQTPARAVGGGKPGPEGRVAGAGKTPARNARTVAAAESQEVTGGYTGSVPRAARVWDALGGGQFRVQLKSGLQWPDGGTEERVFKTLRIAKDTTRGAIPL